MAISKLLTLALLTKFITAIPLPRPDSSQLASCPTNGAIICGSTGYTFSICNWGKEVDMGSVALGTKCVDGKIVHDTAGSGPSTAPIETNVQSSQVEILPTDSTTTSIVYRTSKSTSIQYVTMTREPTTTAVLEPVVTSTSTPAVTLTPTIASSVLTTPPAIVSIPPPALTSTPVLPTSQPPLPSSTPISSNAIKVTEDILHIIAPNSNTCANSPFPEECSTASSAAPFLSQAFSTYSITTPGEAAALLSLIAFESGEFKFNINHFPGRAGQGTRAMLTIPFILSYAQSFGASEKIPAGLTEGNVDTATDIVKNDIRSLVLGDDRSWGSAAWFYQNKCSEEIKKGLQAGVGRSAWEAYVTQCVGTTVTDERAAYWTRAVQALA